MMDRVEVELKSSDDDIAIRKAITSGFFYHTAKYFIDLFVFGFLATAPCVCESDERFLPDALPSCSCKVGQEWELQDCEA